MTRSSVTPEALAETRRSRGMRDVLPDEMERLRFIEDGFRRTCAAWGYREVRTPVIEPMHLFTTAGTLSPQTLDRVYSFLDWDGWSGERVVLRPDSTIPAARLYAEHLDGGRVAKLCYVQNVFRFTDDESPREEWQCGVELIGDTGRAGDVELALLALATLTSLGIGDLRVRVSHAGVVRAVLAAAGLTPEEQSVAYDRLLDGDLAVVDEVEARLPQLNAPLRLLFEVDGAGSGYIANIRSALVGAIPALATPLDELAFVVASLEARSVAPVIQTVLTRNFEYYSGIVMKIDAGEQRAAIGGRYDDLIRLVGGRNVPASGFALYVAPLLGLVSPPPVTPADVLVEAASDSPESLASAFDAAERLRGAGFAAETSAATRPPVARLVCGASQRYSLVAGGVTTAYESFDEVLKALERSR